MGVLKPAVTPSQSLVTISGSPRLGFPGLHWMTKITIAIIKSKVKYTVEIKYELNSFK